MRFQVKRHYDLRAKIEEKVADAMFCEYMFFVNKAHTIAHGIAPAEPDCIWRLKIPSWLKGTTDKYLENYLRKRSYYLLPEDIKRVIPPKPTTNQFTSERRAKYWRKKWSR